MGSPCYCRQDTFPVRVDFSAGPFFMLRETLSFRWAVPRWRCLLFCSVAPHGTKKNVRPTRDCNSPATKCRLTAARISRRGRLNQQASSQSGHPTVPLRGATPTPEFSSGTPTSPLGSPNRSPNFAFSLFFDKEAVLFLQPRWGHTSSDLHSPLRDPCLRMIFLFFFFFFFLFPTIGCPLTPAVPNVITFQIRNYVFFVCQPWCQDSVRV